MAKFDFKKEEKHLYQPKTTPAIVDVPEMLFLAVDGQGDPNTSQELSLIHIFPAKDEVGDMAVGRRSECIIKEVACRPDTGFRDQAQDMSSPCLLYTSRCV